MNKKSRLMHGSPRPGDIVTESGQYAMVFSYYKGGRLLVGRNEITWVKWRRFPPYGVLVLLASHRVLLTSKLKSKGYYLVDKTKHLS
jgi:hypothetical protein